MRKKSIVTFCFVVVLAVLLDLVALCGLPGSMHKTYGGMFDKETGIQPGIDLAGGSMITFEAQATNPTEAQMDSVVAVYETRLVADGHSEARVSKGEGGQVIIEVPTRESKQEETAVDVEIPAVTATEAADAEATEAAEATPAASETAAATEAASPAATEEAAAAAQTETPSEAPEEEDTIKSTASETDSIVELLSEVAKLTFQDEEGNVVLEGTEVSSAKAIYGKPNENANSQWYVQVTFTSEGSKKFSDATAKAVGKSIRICMDDKTVSAPTVNERIDSESCVITGQFTSKDASKLASQINSGNLPFEMKKISQSTIGAELGADALPTSQKAAAIGILLVMLFMVWRYRIPGLVADLSLLIYTGLICLILGATHMELSLPGIAGIVLSIGMAVDADCIIFERMKEELALGKSIRASVEAGFSKAFSAILDSNITTIITCVILYLSGIGTVRGFALTLGIGVILSMFTAIVVTKFLLRNLVNIGIKNRNLFYNTKKKSGGEENE